MFTKNFEYLTQIQDKAVGLIKEYKRIFLNWETGVGKTLPALKAPKEIGGTWLWVMSQNVQEKNIIEECKKFNLKPSFVFVNYRSLSKYEGHTFKGIVLDECHRLTPESAKDLRKIKFEYCICLSASITTERRALLKEVTGYVKSWRITLTEGMKNGIIPPMKIVGLEVPVDLDTALYSVPVKRMNRGSDEIPYRDYERRKRFINTDFFVQGCTFEEYLNVVSSEMDHWKNYYYHCKQQWVKDTRWLPLGALRKRILADHKAKYMQYIQQHLKGKRYVVFAETIEQIQGLEGTCIHSKMPKEEVERAIFKFNTKQIKVLNTVRMLNEGINLSDIDAVVILSLSGVDIQNIQRRGRSTRGVNPVVYVLYVPVTKDHVNFQKFIAGYEEKTKVLHIAELNNFEYGHFTD